MKKTPLKQIGKRKKRESSRDDRFRKAVYSRDEYVCQICYKNMENGSSYQNERTVSHIWSVGSRPEWKYILENAFSCCGECHWKYEHQPGYRAIINVKPNIEALIIQFQSGKVNIIE